ncbi:MAG: hypothetical protein AAGI71_02555 [Bacteroidota bacterium]
MDTLAPYAIYLVLGLTGASLLVIALFGLRSLTFGKVKPQSVVFIAAPLLILGGIGLATGDWPMAGILTVMITFGITLLSLLAFGMRGLVRF